MRAFPHEFSDMLTPAGLRILKGETENSLFLNGKRYFAIFDRMVDKRKADDAVKLMDTHLYPHLAVEQRRIPPESITGMKENYEEVLNKTMHIKTAFFRRSSARSYQAAEKIGLLRMMRSSTFTDFAEAVTGLKLDRDLNLQVSCYEHGDYVGPHNDHHPESKVARNGFVDLHIMFSNDAVKSQWLVYENRGFLSSSHEVGTTSGIAVYRLPFWHYTTPLVGKPGREGEARRWLLLGSFDFDPPLKKLQY